jgi:hypothetical protein
MTRARFAMTLAASPLLALGLAACGASGVTPSPTNTQPATTASHSPRPPTSVTPSPVATESNPPGDIPDTQVYVTYRGASGEYTVEVPEGWGRRTRNGTVTFTDKLNSVGLSQSAVAKQPTVVSARATDVPALRASVPKFQLQDVTTFTRPGGSGVLITYLCDSAPDPVTNKVVRDAVQQYMFWKKGQQVVVALSGPQNADNVDPWARISGSFRWTM